MNCTMRYTYEGRLIEAGVDHHGRHGVWANIGGHDLFFEMPKAQVKRAAMFLYKPVRVSLEFGTAVDTLGEPK